MQRHRSVIQGNFVEAVKGNNVPVCPKPRRLGSTLPDFLKNQGCNLDSQVNYDGRSGVHNMIADKFVHQMELFPPLGRT
ncbi:hypothetical protein LIER_18146 [Lithospermum erythrorhizon]|uniref:Uncharacterized protein n=1 Tax=Lithospermum erythrorhizon TaxID=34254 RepID=A0AAV3QH14_LITER